MLEFRQRKAVDNRQFMQTNSKIKWQRSTTSERLEFIRRNLDKPDAEIAKMLGVHRSAVHQLRTRYKITKVHASTQRQQGILGKMRGLKPGLSAEAAAAQLGITLNRARHFGKMAGYQFRSAVAARHFHWRQRFKSLPPLLTISAVARELGVAYGHAALLCSRHKYKVTVRSRKEPARVPIRRWVKLPHHERWLASLKPEQP